jgi:murein DD-endopeptidase MepM/ murein hydrolase activator NlpD
LIRIILLSLCLLTSPSAWAETTFSVGPGGGFIQGGMVIGQTAPAAKVTLDGRDVRVSPEGVFVFGFTRDFGPEASLTITGPDGAIETQILAIKPRDYAIQRIDGLPPKMVTPPEELLARIRRDSAEVAAARAHDTPEAMFLTGWLWPAKGRISGVYGSQRILNGEPRQPHYGIDIAAPVGSPVIAPADGIVRMAVTDHYYTGGTIILDHGYGLSSAFLHMNSVDVKVGDRLKRGDPMGTIGATGRATGPHLDWRINWFDQRLDPGLLMTGSPEG